MNCATIFYNDAQWLRKDPAPFDARYDAQILPTGSIVCGFLLEVSKEIKELVDPPFMTSEQKQHYQAVLEEARSALHNSIHPPAGSWT